MVVQVAASEKGSPGVVPIAIRPLHAGDIPQVIPIITAAYERPAVRTPEAMAQLRATHRILVAEYDGELAGTGEYQRYGEVAYLGGMAVNPPLQRRGIGEAIVAALVGELDAAGVRTILLDATPAGERLYPRFGFVPAGAVAVWERPAIAPEPERSALVPIDDEELREFAALDAAIFGADRTALIHDLAQHAHALIAVRDSHGTLIAGALDREPLIGPWIGRERAAAERVLHVTLWRNHDVARRVFAPCENGSARDLLRANGFRELRRLTHMRRGVSSPSRRAAMYGQASLGHG